MNILKIIVAINLIFLVACGKQERQAESHEVIELAMQPNMVIEAKNKNGTVIINYVSPLERCYEWGTFNECRTLIPRKERFYGELGAYSPAEAFSWEFYKTRIVAKDSQLRFESMSDLMLWLNEGSAIFDWVYSDNGLVVGFAKSQDRNQINVYVHQLYIKGEKPHKINGSRPENIQTRIRQTP